MTSQDQARIDEIELAYLGLRFACLMASRAFRNKVPHIAAAILSQALRDPGPKHLQDAEQAAHE